MTTITMNIKNEAHCTAAKEYVERYKDQWAYDNNTLTNSPFTLSTFYNSVAYASCV
jgi:hypothetical protein